MTCFAADAAQTIRGSSALAMTTGPARPASARAWRQLWPRPLISWCRSSWSRLKFREHQQLPRPTQPNHVGDYLLVGLQDREVSLRFPAERRGETVMQVGTVCVVDQAMCIVERFA